MSKPSLQCILLVAAGLAAGHAQAPGRHGARSQSFQQLTAKADAARDAERLTEAQSLYRQALAIRPSWAEGWWSLGTVLYDGDHYPDAGRAFTQLLALDPKNGTAHLMLALCQYQLGSYRSALRNIREAEALGIQKDDGLQHVLQYHKGMLLLRKRDYDGATDTLRLLVEEGVHSDDLDLALGMAALLLRPQDLPSDGSEKRQIVLRAGQAERLGISKKYDEAREHYSGLVKEFPEYSNVHYAYGRFLLTVDNADEAVAQFQQEIQNNPKHVRARMQIAAARYRTDSVAGIPYVKEVIALQPRYPFGHYLLGLLYLDSGEITKAVPELQTAVHMVPQEAQFQFALGNAYARAGRKEDAARARATFRRLNARNKQTGPDVYGGEASGFRPPRVDAETEDKPQQ